MPDAEVLSGCKEYLSRIAHIIMEYTPSAWDLKGRLRDEILDDFEIFRVINSPFLINAITNKQFLMIHNTTELYLRKKSNTR